MGFFKAAAEALSPIYKPSGTLIAGVNPGSWASPQQPISPVTQLATGVRTWDFAPGKNLQFTPRGDVAITFGQLWNCSNSFDLCRIAIEMRKNQIVNRPWLIRVKEQPGEKKKERLAREAKTPNVARVQELLKYPDGYHPFDKWIRMWVEQLLTFDAPCVYPVRNLLGDVFQLRIVSGSTITPLIDQQGFVPMPPSPAFQQIILGIPTSNLRAGGGPQDKNVKEWTTDELIYSPMNPRVDSRWGFGPVEQIITTLSIASNRQTFLLDYYRQGNVPEGLLNMPEGWSAQQIKDFQNWFDSMLAGNLGKRRRMIMVPGGGKAGNSAQFTKTEALTDNTDEYLIRVVFGCFGLSPSAYVRQVGHQSTNKEGNDMAQEQGLEPILAHIEVEMNRIIEGPLGCDDVEFAFADAVEVDPLKKSQVDVAYINAGVYTRDERREDNGDDPLGVPQGSIPGITTMQGFVPLDQPTQQQGSDDPSPDGEQPPKNQAGSKVHKSAALKIIGGNLTPRSRQARTEASRVLARFLKDQASRAARTARQKFAAKKVRKDDLETDTDRALVILAAIEWDYPTLYSAMRPYLEIAAEQGAHEGSIQMAANAGANLNDTLSQATAQAKVAAGNRAAEMVGLQIEDDGTVAEATGAHWAISTTAKDDVLNAIKQAIKEQWKPEQLEAVIQASTIFSPDHADMTASNEIERQQAYGHLLSWRASGMVLEYRWTVADAGCCPLCASFALQGSVPVDHDFGDGIFAPGAHPECRCWLTATKFRGED